MDNSNTLTVIAQWVNIAAPILMTALQSYGVFKKSNVEKFFKKIVDSKVDISEIGQREDLKRYFLSIIDKVANEANEKKIDEWKNAILHLATDFKDFEFKDNYITILDNLTVQDLTILLWIYCTHIEDYKVLSSCVSEFEKKSVPKDMVIMSLKRLSSHGLIEEVSRGATTFGSLMLTAEFSRNSVGKEFLDFISGIDQIHIDNER